MDEIKDTVNKSNIQLSNTEVVKTYSLVVPLAVSHALLLVVSATFKRLLAVGTHEMLQRERDDISFTLNTLLIGL
jgi:hypothetical protein